MGYLIKMKMIFYQNDFYQVHHDNYPQKQHSQPDPALTMSLRRLNSRRQSGNSQAVFSRRFNTRRVSGNSQAVVSRRFNTRRASGNTQGGV